MRKLYYKRFESIVSSSDIGIKETELRWVLWPLCHKSNLQVALQNVHQRVRRIDFARQQKIQTELQQVQFTIKKLKKDKDLEMNEITHTVEKRMLTKHIMELKDFVLSMKLTINDLKNHEERMEIQKKLREELQTIRVINNKLQMKYETVIGIEVDLRTELERVKTANDKLNKYWKSALKGCEEEKEILVTRIKELQKEL